MIKLEVGSDRLHYYAKHSTSYAKRNTQLALQTQTVPCPRLPSKSYLFMTHIYGWLHEFVLIPISVQYCRSRPHLPAEPGIYPLPFNLLLKFTSGTREEEGLAMRVARSMGIPVPRFISYGNHGSRWPWGSILMTRIPGKPLNEVFDSLPPSELETIKTELAYILERMRCYSSPWGAYVCGIDGHDVYGSRIPLRHIPAAENEAAFYQSLLPFAVDRRAENYAQLLATAENMVSLMPHAIVFTHGDLWHHKIIVDRGHISGIIDWEWAGWLPEYWEYTTIMRWTTFPWSKFMATLPGYKYEKELVSDAALTRLSADCFMF
ncbi:hypothetical protein A0H81_10890 [Grifola frondosa]|uniref:Aminoglycoside phosphotransferase domain-containing protein n=1 Tax=Grifola frondosa TaxID=5627 RepID=A0A1C7LYA7_GRIFR|nr:hypothetical protein A0H81_10890 [Grifola frondosa]